MDLVHSVAGVASCGSALHRKILTVVCLYIKAQLELSI